MVRITKTEMKKLRQEFPLRYFHSTKHHIFVEERPSVRNALKILRAAVCVVLLILTLAACGRKDTTAILYRDDALTVTREGHRTTVSDAISGVEYHFSIRRVQKAQTAEEAAQRAIFRQVVKTDTMSIELVRDAIIIRETDGKSICIR